MKQLKKAVILTITKLELGGAQKVCLQVFRGLQSQNIPVTLVSGTHGHLVATVAHDKQAQLLPELSREYSGIWQEIGCFFRLVSYYRLQKKQHPNLIVHTHSTKAGIVGRIAAWCANVPFRVHTIHGYAFHAYQPWYIWYCLYVLELIASLVTTHFICVSVKDAATGIRLFPGFSQKHTIIRAAIDRAPYKTASAKLHPGCTSTSPFIFGSIACFKPQKNIADLIRAFACVHHQYPHTRLEIIGDGAERTSLESLIASYDLSNDILLQGWQEKVAPYLNRWHAFTLSSLWEGLPCAIVEARLAHLPVACYNVGGIADIITHEKNGLLCTPGVWLELAQAMERLICDTALYDRLSTQRDMLDQFDHEYMVNEHIHLYKTMTQLTRAHKQQSHDHSIRIGL